MPIIEDNRIGGETRYICTTEPLMLIPDEMRKCVAYIGYRLSNGMEKLAGSAFFVGRRIADDIPGQMFGYVVTAAHVIEHIRDLGLPSVLLRVNFKTGAQWIEKSIKDWKIESSSDIAVCHHTLGNELDHRQWPLHGFVTPQIGKDEEIGIGEDVFFMGLFSQHYGKEKNVPIVRIGNIAAMPEEPIQTKGGSLSAYLVEARSIGGLSGSPVFVNTGGFRGYRVIVPYQRFRLLGMVHGHFDVQEGELDFINSDNVQRPSINMGIAVVVPSEEIQKVIEQFADDEKPIVEKIRQALYPTLDTH